MRHVALPALMVLASACGGNESTVSPTADASSDVGVDVQACAFLASNYDQSCAVDTDCSEVTSTDYCSSQCLCGGSPISAAGLAQFNAAIATTPLGSGAIRQPNCGCPRFGRVCCLNGTCKIDTLACDEKDTLAACADAGGVCDPNVEECGKGEGPANSCALPNETCCLN